VRSVATVIAVVIGVLGRTELDCGKEEDDSAVGLVVGAMAGVQVRTTYLL
jgi:hypothetical protein